MNCEKLRKWSKFKSESLREWSKFKSESLRAMFLNNETLCMWSKFESESLCVMFLNYETLLMWYYLVLIGGGLSGLSNSSRRGDFRLLLSIFFFLFFPRTLGFF